MSEQLGTCSGVCTKLIWHTLTECHSRDTWNALPTEQAPVEAGKADGQDTPPWQNHIYDPSNPETNALLCAERGHKVEVDGTFNCPICGSNEIHNHSSEEIAAHRSKPTEPAEPSVSLEEMKARVMYDAVADIELGDRTAGVICHITRQIGYGEGRDEGEAYDAANRDAYAKLPKPQQVREERSGLSYWKTAWSDLYEYARTHDKVDGLHGATLFELISRTRKVEAELEALRAKVTR